MKKPCEDCRGAGFLLMQNDVHGLRIERCDTCRKYCSDDAAVTAAFNAATRTRERLWRRIKEQDVRHRWDLACKCRNVEPRVYVEPWFYAHSGTPICQECGKDRTYVRAEVRPCR